MITKIQPQTYLNNPIYNKKKQRISFSQNPVKIIQKTAESFEHELPKLVAKLQPKYDISAKKPVQWAIKRAFDYVGATAGTIITAPVMAVTSMAIKLESKGPVLFLQKRIGKDGEEFTIYKFRSMFLENCGSIEQVNINNDPRITKVGKVIRKFSIDEIPQFFNILKGDMSLIGPRPLQKSTCQKLFKTDKTSVSRYTTLPGAMFKYSNRNTLSNEKKIFPEKEKEYIENWTLLKDAKHFVSVMKKIVLGRNY